MAITGGTQQSAPTGVTLRAVAIALALVAALVVAGYYIELVLDLSYDFNTQSPPIAPLGVFFLAVLVNAVVVRRWRGLSRKELLVIYAMVTVGAPVVAHGTLLWLLCISIGQHEVARTMTDWPNAFFRYIPPWFSPTDPNAVDGFFRGESSVPWGLWLQPLVVWGLFFLALYGANLSLLVIFRRQWITNERLSFPVAHVPMESVREGSDGRARFSSARGFQVGFAVVFVLGLLYRLSSILPSLPSIPLDDYVVVPWHPTGPLAGFGDFTISLSPTITGLAYLIPKELSFSVWFFWYARVAETVAAIAAGVTPMKPQDYWGTEFPAPYYQGAGAVIALGVLAFWSGRHYLGSVLRNVLRGRPGREACLSGRGRGEEDISAPLGYRLAFAGLVLSLGYMVAFCMAAGSRLIVALPLVGLSLTYHMVWARLRAENGMSFIGFPFSAGTIMQEPLGTAILRPQEIVTINALSWVYWPGWGEGCEVITGASLDALKISDSARIGQRPLLAAMSAAVIFALVAGILLMLTGTYLRGFWNYNMLYRSWMIVTMRNLGQGDYDGIVNPSHFSLPVTMPLVGGMVVVFVLAALRTRLWWWPLHPAGYLAANIWGTQAWWCPMFIGWLVKTLVIRYGGLRLYQKTMPVAIGMILADRLLSFLWPVVIAVTRS